jgi:arsenate reductase
MITIYHNPRCQKSREGMALVEASGKPFKVIRYMEDSLPAGELKKLCKLLGIQPIELVRTKEKIWKEKYRDKSLSDAEILTAMATHPNLIERPIVVYREAAVIGRPADKINALLKL